MEQDRRARQVFRVSAGFLVFATIFGGGMLVGARGYPPLPQIQELADTVEELVSPEAERFSQVEAVREEQVESVLPDRLQPGLVLVSGDVGPQQTSVRVIDRDGTVVHEWRPRFQEIWPEGEGTFPERPTGDRSLHGLQLLPDGSIVANFENQSTFRMDVCGEVLWKLDNLGHHTVDLAPDGTLWVPAEDPVPEGEEVGLPNHRAPYRSWLLQNITVDGEIVQSIPVSQVLQDNDLEGWLYMQSKESFAPEFSGDTLHLNSIQAFPTNLPSDLFDPGDLLISLRNVNTVMVLDGRTMRSKFISTGPFVRQHHPQFMPDDAIAVFDNRPLETLEDGGEPHSQVVEVDARTGAARTALSGEQPQEPFYTEVMGAQEVLPNGNLLVAVSGEGRVLEFLPDGRLAWWWENRMSETENGRTINASVLPQRLDEEFFEQKEAACQS